MAEQPRLGTPGELQRMAFERAVGLHEHIRSLPADKFAGKPWALVDEIESYNDTQQGVPMIFNKPKIQLSQAVLASMTPKPKILLEFGTFIGNSALAWAAILHELNTAGATNVHVYSFEVEPKMVEIARNFVNMTGLNDVVTVMEGPGSDSVKKLVAEAKLKPRGVDAVFFDHWEKFYLPDLKLCEELELLHEGSMIIADNTDIPGSPDYNAYIDKGGSGEPGAVSYETTIREAKSEGPRPRIVKFSKVLSV